MIITWVFGFLSIVCDILLLIGFSRLKEMWRFPAQLIAVIVMCNLIRTTVSVIVLLVEGTDLGCNNDYEVADWDNKACAAQGFVSGALGMITSTNCCFVVFCIMLAVVFGVKPTTVEKLMIPAYLLSFGPAIGIQIGTSATNNVAGAPSLLWACSTRVFAYDWYWAALGVIVFTFALGCIVNAITIITLIWNPDRRKMLLHNNLSLLVFITTYLVMIGMSVSYGVNGFAHRNVWRDNLQEMVQCSISTRFVDINEYYKCDANGPSYIFNIAYNIVFNGIGIWLFLCFLVHKRFIATWLDLLHIRKMDSSSSKLTMSKVSGLKGSASGSNVNYSHSASKDSKD
eukprot:TRINITY_DN4964_c0_g1_i1.p1 TRINITY_DN4964_c0_g1~~TRINITY_DN4964_c0_g1_i1.p1  ORF type:complete len:342 (-),score=39.14 TRINITY_DN4964_c0_g1_i1:130-1155(-)